jgi:predicted nucleotide-binding protein
MPATITKIRIFVASPSDVSQERDHLSHVVAELSTTVASYKGFALELIRWETHAIPGMGRPQGLINEQIGEYDIFVGIMWRRFGTATGVADSGTEEEFRIAYDRWLKNPAIRILFYFSQRPFMPRAADEIQQLAKVLDFRKDLDSRGLVSEYKDSDDFPNVVRPHLTRLLLDMAAEQAPVSPAKPPAAPSIFITSSPEGLPIARGLSEILGRAGILTSVWTGGPSPSTLALEALTDIVTSASAAVIILSADDSTSHGKAPRANVVLELGFFLGSLGRRRTFILAPADVALPSDIMGAIYLRFEPERLESVVEQLRREFREIGITDNPKK